MCRKIQTKNCFIYILLFYICFPLIGHTAGIIADHNAVTEFDAIPDSVIREIRDNHQIYYGHTSHGGQILTGAWMLQLEDTLYTRPTFFEVGDDLGYDGDTTWAPQTRSYLNANPNIDIVIWSWCGGVTYNTESGINTYLNKYNELEQAYPDVVFIYMTGHLDGTGIGGNLYARNNQIRAYCNANNKILYDFADIESYDPDGNYYPDESDACAWCANWCLSYDCVTCECAHSHCFNCYIKGKAFWWLMAQAVGWSLSLDVEDDINNGLPQSFKLNQNYPNPFNLSTEISFEVPTASNVKINVYDILGKNVNLLIDEFFSVGRYSVNWDGHYQNGQVASTGIYFYQLKIDDFTETRKMILLK